MRRVLLEIEVEAERCFRTNDDEPLELPEEARSVFLKAEKEAERDFFTSDDDPFGEI